MKKVFFAVLSLTLVFTACKKEEVEPTPTVTVPTTPEPEPTEPFYTKIDGVEFSETSVETDYSYGTIEIKALGPNNTYVMLYVPSDITKGSYTFKDPIVGEQAAYYNDGNSTYANSSGTGTLTITSHSPAAINVEGEIKGFFSFNAEEYSFSSGSDSYTVTEGEFVVNY